MTQMQNNQQPTGTPFDQQKSMPGIKKIIAVSSGKGGVGKSTVAVNLAAALKEQIGEGKVGILDTDIYGPSIPRMMGALNQKPEIKGHLLKPLERGGIKLMSIGFIVEEDMAVVWRGPMLFKAIDQFLRDVEWGDLEYLVLDLPPGTGDVQLTLAQKIPINAAVVVTTPQNISLADVKKAIDMWGRVKVPILGVVENMSYLEINGQEKMQLFPKGELRSFLDSKKIPLISEIPFQPKIAVACETGISFVSSSKESTETKIFLDLALQVQKFCTN